MSKQIKGTKELKKCEAPAKLGEKFGATLNNYKVSISKDEELASGLQVFNVIKRIRETN